MVSGVTRTLDLPVTQQQLDSYAQGALLQNAFGNLNPDEREFIKSGITAEEWESLFGGEEEYIPPNPHSPIGLWGVSFPGVPLGRCKPLLHKGL